MEYRLGDIVKVNRGASPRPIIEYLDKTGYPWLKISDFKLGDRYVYNTKEFIRKEGITKTRIVAKGTLILTNSATPGIPIVLGKDMCLHDGFLYFTEIDEKILNKQYLYYYFLLNRKYIVNNANGSVFKNLKKEIVENLILELPPLNDQLKIVEILNNINKKIELNNQINNSLYKLGDELYKEYYLKLKNNLPEDYEIKLLSEVAQNFDCKRKPLSSREREIHHGIYPYYGATSIIDYVDDYIFDGTYVLMGEDGTVKNEKGNPVLQYIWGKNWINNHAHVLKGIKISTEHLYFALRNVNIESLITGAVQPKINQENMNKIKFIIGNNEKNSEFEKISESIMQKSKLLIEENKTLGQLRDTLLPKLINGEIDLENIKI